MTCFSQGMKILITSGGSHLAQQLAGALSAEHSVALTDLVDVPTEHTFRRCSLEADEKTDELVRGVDTVIHPAVIPDALLNQSDDVDGLRIDYHTRLTYNLFHAASEEGVRHALFCSTLRLFANHDPNWTVSERWWTSPTVEAAVLGPYLGEFVCREFAREGRLQITCLRFGTLVSSEEASGKPPDPEWLEYGDAVAACRGALEHQVLNWSLYHIQSKFPGSRYSSALASKEIGYVPRFRPLDANRD